MLDERERRQAKERENGDLRRQAETARQPEVIPDVASDPQGWQKAQEARFEKERLDMRMDMSGRYAAQTFGGDQVEAAMAWGHEQSKADPFFGPKFLAQNDPFGWLVAEHRRANALGWLGDKSPEERALEYAASMGYVKPAGDPNAQQPAVTTVAAQPISPARPTPSRSIANAPPAGGTASQPVLGEREVGDLWTR